MQRKLEVVSVRLMKQLEGYSQQEERNDDNGSAERASSALAEALHGLNLENRNDEPEHDLENVENHIDKRTFPAAEARNMLGEKLVPNHNDRFGTLVLSAPFRPLSNQDRLPWQ